MASESLREALRYWEPRRIWYNLALTALAGAWVLFTWPHFRPALTLHHLQQLLVLAALANVCYSAAYLVDIPMQESSFSVAWRQRRWASVAGGHPVRSPLCLLLDRGRDLSVCQRRLTPSSRIASRGRSSPAVAVVGDGAGRTVSSRSSRRVTAQHLWGRNSPRNAGAARAVPDPSDLESWRRP